MLQERPLKELKQHSELLDKMCSSCVLSEGKTVLEHLFLSKERTILFPEDRLEYDWVPFKPILSNINKVLDSRSLVLYSRDASNKALLSIGNWYPCSFGIRCNVSFYGDETSDTLIGHLARHLRSVAHVNDITDSDSLNVGLILVVQNELHFDHVSKITKQLGFSEREFIQTFMCCSEVEIK